MHKDFRFKKSRFGYFAQILHARPAGVQPKRRWLFVTTQTLRPVKIIAANGAGLRDCPLLDALDNPGALGGVFKHLSATPNQTLHTENGGIDARAATPVGRTVGRYPRLTL